MTNFQGSDLALMKKELEKQKDLVSSLDIKVKWHQNKLKAEQDAHKEMKTKFEDSDDKLKTLIKEVQMVWDQLRVMYKAYQVSNWSRTITEFCTKYIS